MHYLYRFSFEGGGGGGGGGGGVLWTNQDKLRRMLIFKPTEQWIWGHTLQL